MSPNAPSAAPPERLLRLPEVLQRTGIRSRSGLYRMIQEGNFPRSLRLSHKTAVWQETSVQKWIDEKVAEFGAPA